MAQYGSRDLLLSPANGFQPAEVLEHCYRATAKDFDSFLRIRFVSIGEVADCAMRSIGEAQRADYGVVAVFAGVGQTVGLYFNGSSPHQESQEVSEVANFSDDPATAQCRIIQPVIGRNEASIHAVMNGQRLINSSKK